MQEVLHGVGVVDVKLRGGAGRGGQPPSGVERVLEEHALFRELCEQAAVGPWTGVIGGVLRFRFGGVVIWPQHVERPGAVAQQERQGEDRRPHRGEGAPGAVVALRGLAVFPLPVPA